MIVADGDAPGQRGAETLGNGAARLLPVGAHHHAPGRHKDAREWKRRGATAADVQAAIDAAPVRRLAVSVFGERQVASWKTIEKRTDNRL